jgi:transcriptional regulator with XRE-family HTH domain
MLFGDFIHKMRVRSQLTLRQVCQETGVKPDSWSAVERNALPPNREIVIALVPHLNLSASETTKLWSLFQVAIGRTYPKYQDDATVANSLPMFARTPSNKKVGQAQLNAIVDLTRKNY